MVKSGDVESRWITVRTRSRICVWVGGELNERFAVLVEKLMRFDRAPVDNCPASSSVLSESTRFGSPAEYVRFDVHHGPMSSMIAPLPLLKLLRPFVFPVLLWMPDSRKFMCSATV